MKVNGTDSLIKSLLELNNQNLKMPPSSEKVNIKNLSNKVEELLIQKDEVNLRGDSLVKAEIQFTRQHHETAEAYLQRISSEMIKIKESQNGEQEDNHQLLHSNEYTADIALRFGLLKEYGDGYKQEENTISNFKETKWILIFSASFIAVLIIYLIFRK